MQYKPTIVDNLPLSSAYELMARLFNAVLFSKVDIRSVYYYKPESRSSVFDCIPQTERVVKVEGANIGT